MDVKYILYCELVRNKINVWMNYKIKKRFKKFRTYVYNMYNIIYQIHTNYNQLNVKDSLRKL
jgi:hypothetical protein